MLGVCYYPEHWPRERWARDAARMVELGLAYVRIGEFCWSRIEPARGAFAWDWLDDAIEVLGSAGLRVVLGTPTATPPRWLVEEWPEILAWDAEGRPRRFGSRRHYCFSSPVWREESRRIVELVAGRYGAHAAVDGWQLDNEYGCHDTVVSYAPHCVPAFQDWLARRYRTIEALNQAWGTVFWSQEYAAFDQVPLPNLTVTEANPAHRLDYRRFSSDQVQSYHLMQARIVRARSPGRFIAHNVMGFFDQFDHFALADEVDVCGWDSYPLGFTACMMALDDAERVRFARTGHPDVAALHHDLYRSAVEQGARRGRMWVMEQQPGPVNWAPYNPAPAPGMVRLWTWEALAHGAEAVCYFRWRQMPRAQEQMHAALYRPDDAPAPARDEVERVAAELADLDREVPAWRRLPAARAPVALLFDYQAAWILDIQPHGVGPSYLTLVRQCYTALRRLGVDVDLIRSGAAIDGYHLVVAPTLPILGQEAWDALERGTATVVLGARSGSRTDSFAIPDALPPGRLQRALPIRVAAVDSVRPDMPGRVRWHERDHAAGTWREIIESALEPAARFTAAPDGGPDAKNDVGPDAKNDAGPGAVFAHGRWHYLAFWPGEAFWMDYLESLLAARGVATVRLPETLRLRRRGPLVFACNTSAEPATAPAPADARFVLGARTIEPHGVAAWLGPAGD